MTLSPFRPVLAAAIVAVACLWTAPAARAQAEDRATILDVAPLDSFLALTIPDWPAARTALMRSDLGNLWREPTVRNFLRDLFREEMTDDDEGQEIASWFEENLDWDDVREPTGAAGAAFFTLAGADPDEPRRGHMIMMADFGEDAAAFMEAITGLLERLERERKITLDEDEHDGVDVHTIAIVGAEEDEDEEDFGPFPSMRKVHMALSNGRIVVSSDRGALDNALDRLAGRRMQSLADNRAYRAAAGQHPRNSHALFVALVNDYVRGGLRDMAEGLMFFMPARMDPDGILNALGVNAVEAFGIGVRFDTDAGSMEQTIGVLAPEKRGLLSLIDSELPRFDPPAFAPADAVGVYSVAFRFDRIMGLIRGVLRALPPEMRGEAQAMEGAAEAAIGPVLNSLGSEIHVISTLAHPLGPESQRQFVAIRVRDPLTLANAINGFAPQLGLTARDFEGNQIFEPDPDAGGPTIGIGFDHVFLGPIEEIENAMRLASRADAPRLAAADRFRRAAAAAPGGANLYNYTNLAESLEWQYWSIENAERVYEASLDWLPDEGMKQRMMQHFREAIPEWHSKLPPRNLILQHLGDSITEIRPTPDGFRGRSVMLRPAR